METPRFYINPLTGRMIKSTAKIFKKLKREKYVIDKHKCLYNIKSAERCFNKLFKLYPDIVYPSSNFIDIPKTYKRGSIRAFIGDKKKLNGYIDKTGKKYKLQKNIKSIKNIKRVPIVKDLNDNLKNIVDKLPEIDNLQQKIVEDQIKYDKPIKRIDDINIIFNPLQNDFVSVNKKINKEEIQNILEIVNGELIPKKLIPISKDFDYAGIIKDNENIYGLVDTSNQIKRFDKPVKIKYKEQKRDIEKSDTISIPESLLKTQESESDIISPLSDVTLSDVTLSDVTLSDVTLSEPTSTPSLSETTPSLSEPTSTPSLSPTLSDVTLVEPTSTPSLSPTLSDVTLSEPTPTPTHTLVEASPILSDATLVENEIENEYIESLPEVEFIKTDDVKIMEDKLVESPIVESEAVIKQIKCLDGSQWDINENRCISCDKYGLVWDAEYRSCKIMLKDTIKKIIKTGDEIDSVRIGLKIVTDNKDKILGYLE